MAQAVELVEDLLVVRERAHSPLLTPCSAPGCSTLTMGGTCVEHDVPVTTIFPRGRPYVAQPETLAESLRVRSPA
ncbi:hypothetical protein [Gaiella sp.]|jgi:hypothetical protein|uniref:hypothetical protein n=1 Tax=Gaiella sp. TaxID=2663207 RepID=UPI002E364AD6|nr:hypothetical protein [Gaiella sp.]HEX5583898.1 hypothetical protein [Gaiella sp.]